MVMRSVSKDSPKNPKALANHEIVTIALFLCGGDARSVDTEDIAVKASEIAPGRFAWRKYPDQINIDTVRKRLWDARKSDRGGFLTGSEKDGWQLTESGVRFAKRARKDFRNGAPLTRTSLKERRFARAEKLRMLDTDAYAKFSSGFPSSITAREAEAFFRIDDYVVGEERQKKVLRALNLFGSDRQLGPAVRFLAIAVREKVT
jgi:hypothetical protein